MAAGALATRLRDKPLAEPSPTVQLQTDECSVGGSPLAGMVWEGAPAHGQSRAASRLVLHFDINKTIIMCDPVKGVDCKSRCPPHDS